ncbi:hypothetical protein RCC89_20330 [Cytophagaceae bacterium ABcell3]|nr:hypothetical protein RCC89_20330 [Cytophagaceae bacterium ABcell3]
MKEKIFITTYDEESKRSVVIDEDDHAIWAYLTLPDAMEVDFPGFICSVKQPVSEVEDPSIYFKQGVAPPITKSFSNEFTFLPEVKASQFSVEWDEQASHVKVLVNAQVFLVMDYVNRCSYSKGLSSESPYGLPLDEK